MFLVAGDQIVSPRSLDAFQKTIVRFVARYRKDTCGTDQATRAADIQENCFYAARIEFQLWFVKYPLILGQYGRRDQKSDNPAQREQEDGGFQSGWFEQSRDVVLVSRTTRII